jgi:hypothetical protein
MLTANFDTPPPRIGISKHYCKYFGESRRETLVSDIFQPDCAVVHQPEEVLDSDNIAPGSEFRFDHETANE